MDERDAADPGKAGGEARGSVASTGCLVVGFAVLIAVLVVAPAALWGAGIACG